MTEATKVKNTKKVTKVTDTKKSIELSEAILVAIGRMIEAKQSDFSHTEPTVRARMVPFRSEQIILGALSIYLAQDKTKDIITEILTSIDTLISEEYVYSKELKGNTYYGLTNKGLFEVNKMTDY